MNTMSSAIASSNPRHTANSGRTTVKKAIQQLAIHRDGLRARGEDSKAVQTDEFIKTLSRSNDDYLLDAFEHSKKTAEKMSLPLKLYEDGTVFPIVGVPTVVALMTGLATGPVGLGLAAAGTAAYVTGVFAAGERLHAHSQLAKAGDSLLDAVENPLKLDDSPNAKYSKQQLLQGYDEEIAVGSLRSQKKLRAEKAELASLPDGNAAELMLSHPEKAQSLRTGLDLVKLQEREGHDSRPKSLADTPVKDLLAPLAERQMAQLANLDEKAAAKTGKILESLKASPDGTVLEAYENLEAKKSRFGNLGTAATLTGAATLLAAGFLAPLLAPLAIPAATAGVPLVAAGIPLVKAHNRTHESQTNLVDPLHEALAEPVPPNEKRIDEIGREAIFSHINDRLSTGSLNEQSFYRQSRNKLEKLAGDNGLEMFTNAFDREKKTELASLKRILTDMVEI